MDVYIAFCRSSQPYILLVNTILLFDQGVCESMIQQCGVVIEIDAGTTACPATTLVILLHFTTIRES
jgi:hypothetical protein